MSDIENSIAAENATENGPSSPTVEVIDKGNYSLEYKFIDDGENKGFGFYVPKVKSVSGAIAHFTENSQNGADGEEIVLALINAALAARIRNKAVFKVTPPAKVDGKLLSVGEKEAWKAERLEWLNDPTKRILVSQEEAGEYVPGEREVDSISGLQKQQKALHKSIVELAVVAKKAKAEGDVDLFEKTTKEIKIQYAKHAAVTEEINKRQVNELDELKNAFGL